MSMSSTSTFRFWIYSQANWHEAAPSRVDLHGFSLDDDGGGWPLSLSRVSAWRARAAGLS